MRKIAFVFSGQGAQYPGMGKALYESSPAAKSVFDMADSIRKGTIRQCFEGSSGELCRTVNTQPCVFTADLAAAYAVKEAKIIPDCVAGFSLGEIAALAFSGMLTDEEALRLVCKRGELMDQAAAKNSGSMIAVMKITPMQVEAICAQFSKTYPVNYNSPAQTVVATTEENIAAFCETVKAAGGRAKQLSVSGAFHSPFMSEAAARLADYMRDIDFKEPMLPVYSDYTARPYEGDYKELVRAQVSNPVRWQMIVENIIAQGIDTFIEVGVGKTLVNLIQRIDKSVKTFKVETPEDILKIEL